VISKKINQLKIFPELQMLKSLHTYIHILVKNIPDLRFLEKIQKIIDRSRKKYSGGGVAQWNRIRLRN
jgi:hypothetical protein